jgi:hypothetical protein
MCTRPRYVLDRTGRLTTARCSPFNPEKRRLERRHHGRGRGRVSEKGRMSERGKETERVTVGERVRCARALLWRRTAVVAVSRVYSHLLPSVPQVGRVRYI